MHATPIISFGVLETRKASRTSISVWEAPSRIERKVVNFHPILCMPALSITRSQRRSKYESIVQETRRNSEMSGDKWKKEKPPNYNSWVAKPKKMATRRCFYETRVIESKSKTKSSMLKEKKTNYSASKSASPQIPPKHLTVFASVFMPSDFAKQRKF